MRSVAFKEGVKISAQALEKIIIACNYDIRQVWSHAVANMNECIGIHQKCMCKFV